MALFQQEYFQASLLYLLFFFLDVSPRVQVAFQLKLTQAYYFDYRVHLVSIVWDYLSLALFDLSKSKAASKVLRWRWLFTCTIHFPLSVHAHISVC